MTARRLASGVAPLFATFLGLSLFSACSSDQAPAPTFSVAGASSQTGGSGNTSAGTGNVAGSTGIAGTSSTVGGATNSSGAGGMSSGGSTTVAGGGSAGSAGSTGTTHYNTPRGQSAACGMGAPAGDNANTFVEHDIEVTGVDPAFIAANPPQSPAPWTWTHRNYFVRLPTNYDPTKAYPISMGGGGCGSGDGKSGNGGGLTAYSKGETDVIQVGLSYVWTGGACFEDDYVNTPDAPYFDAVLADLEAHYCVDKSKVYVDGYSSGAWESYMLGCARAGVVRAIGTAAGGLRITRPPCTTVPIAAMMLNGLQDDENPIGPLTTPKNDSYGSAPARDDILMRNGCIGTQNTPWDPDYPGCVQYTGCPAEFPVVWCAYMDGHGDGNPAGAKFSYSGMGFAKFWASLPAVP
jgi:polyhydroxybutyrate depolymerase